MTILLEKKSFIFGFDKNVGGNESWVVMRAFYRKELE